jgi:hypothetical protein
LDSRSLRGKNLVRSATTGESAKQPFAGIIPG